MNEARKLKWLAPLAALVLLAGAAQAVEMLRIPDDIVVPIYTWGFDDATSGWTATVFYHPPECVPENFNLLSGDDPNMDPNCPMLVVGFTLWEEGAAAPSQVVLHNAEGTQVPIYLVKIPELYDGIADGELTVNELQEMDSLLIGMADSYHEVWHPSGAPEGIRHWRRVVVASGTLEDGRSFYVHFEANHSNDNATVTFGD